MSIENTIASLLEESRKLQELETPSEIDEASYDNLTGRGGVSTDPAKIPDYMAKTAKGKTNRAKANLPVLKSLMKLQQGRHPKPNLPEEVEIVDDLATIIPDSEQTQEQVTMDSDSKTDQATIDTLNLDDLLEAMEPGKKQRLNDLIDRHRNATDPTNYEDNPENPDHIIGKIKSEFGHKIAGQVEAGTTKAHFGRDNRAYGNDLLSYRGGSKRVTKAGKLNKTDAKGLKTKISSSIGTHKKSNLPEEYDMSADVDALFNGEDGLTEEFRQKAETIFEAAVVSRVKEEIAQIEEQLQEQYEQALQEAVEQKIEGLVEHVDGYLNLVVEQWMENNEIALKSGVKTEVLESFIGGMKTLFQEHNIEVPEEKVDLIESMENKIKSLSAKLDETVATNIEMLKVINEAAKNDIINEACDGLSDVEADKLQSLAEEIEFTDAGAFETKIKTIRENYFSKKTVDTKPSAFITEETIHEEKTVPSEMSAYVKTISSLAR